jgi:hypothetical protein
MDVKPSHRRIPSRHIVWSLSLLAVVAAFFAVGAAAQARQRISLDEILIEGNIQKPEAFFILPRTSLNFEDLERREDLKKRIIESVERSPF